MAQRNLITDVAGVLVGHADDARLASGVTVIVFEEPAVAAVEQIEQHGAAHERHANVPDREATPALAQESLNARASVQAEGRAAGQHHGIDALDGAVRFEQIGFTRARRAAAHIDRGDGRLFENDCRDAGSETRVMGVSDQDASDIRDEIARHQRLLGL